MRDKTLKYHRYRSITSILMRILGNTVFLPIGLLCSIIATLNILVSLYNRIAGYSETLTLTQLGVGLFFAAFFLLFGLIFPNLFPDLAQDDKGLYVKFYFKWLFVPWENVVAFRQTIYSIFVPSSRKLYFVLVRKNLTPIHWLISLNQLGGWGPGFLLSPTISDYQDLVRSIKRNTVE